MRTLTLLFPEIRFYSIPANIESPTIRVVPFFHCLIELDPAFSVIGYSVSIGTLFPFFSFDSQNLLLDSFLTSFSWMFIFSVIGADFSIVSSLISLDDDWYFEVLSFENLILAFLTQSFMSLHSLVTSTLLLKVVFSNCWIGVTFSANCCGSVSVIRCLLSNSFLRKFTSSSRN